ncbi:MAG: hypothetical protein EP335_09870 [Alphaproteobacteria bacterium]|nr:MAG: hypothetical protein EP335_09870 [Alphaproteobacteria bacterium]
MAKPLPDDIKHIAENARRAEIRSVATMAFILGIAVGFGLGAAFFRAAGSGFFFFIGAAMIGVMWFLAARRRKVK